MPLNHFNDFPSQAVMLKRLDEPQCLFLMPINIQANLINGINYPFSYSQTYNQTDSGRSNLS